MIHQAHPICSRACRSLSSRKAVTVLASAPAASNRAAEQVARRQILGSGLALASLLLPSLGASAEVDSALCSTFLFAGKTDLAEECRVKVLGAGSTESYGKASERKGMTIVEGVPVAKLDSEYARATLAVLADIEAYTAVDIYDKARPSLIKKMKSECIDWVSKYARGGSARTDSARRAYIAVDSVVGFLASNGLAPYPAGKAKTVLATIAQARTYLAEGK